MNTMVQTCEPSPAIGRERTRFFPRQLVTHDDLTQDQLYFREKLRRHNRMLHGWGVVCGARVNVGKNPCEVIVEAGYILGPYGDEIMIDRDITVDLCNNALDGNAVSPCVDPMDDPWCSQIPVSRPVDQTLYLAIRYAECHTRPVRAAASGCGCDASACEYSRIRDGFAIKVLTTLPSTYSDPMPQPEFNLKEQCDANATCPSCPTEPWVILADVKLKSDSTISSIDCFAHRRFVLSFANYYYLCKPQTETALLKLVNLRILTLTPSGGESDLLAGGAAKAKPTDQPIKLPSDNPLPIFEAQFSEAPDPSTVTVETFFVAEQAALTAPTGRHLQGELKPVPGEPTKFRLILSPNDPVIPTGLSEGRYRVTLVGQESPPRIRTASGAVLDGDPGKTTLAPSGDGTAGGDFTLDFAMQQIIN